MATQFSIKRDSFVPDSGDSFAPDSFVADNADSFVADASAPAAIVPAQPQEKKSWLKKAWEWSGKPLVSLEEPRKRLMEAVKESKSYAPYERSNLPGALEPFRIFGKEDVAAGVASGIAGAAEGMTSPRSIAMIPALGLATSASLGIFGFINSLGLAGDTAARGYVAWKRANEAAKAGDAVRAAEGRTEAVLNGLMAFGIGAHGIAGAKAPAGSYAKSVEILKAGLQSPHLDAGSLEYITEVINKSDLPLQDKVHLISIAQQRSAQMPRTGPVVASSRTIEPPAPGTLATGPFPGPTRPQGPTIRQQFNMPTQTPIPVPEAAGPAGPLPELPNLQPKPPVVQIPTIQEIQRNPPKPYEEAILQPKPAVEPRLPIYQPPPETPPFQMQKPLPVTPPEAKIDFTAPILEKQRRTIFAIASDRGLPKESIEKLAGKPISQLNVGEAQDLMRSMRELAPEDIARIKPPVTTPLLDQVRQSDQASTPQPVQFQAPAIIPGDKVTTLKGNGIAIEVRKNPDGGKNILVRIKDKFEWLTNKDVAKQQQRIGGIKLDPDKSLANAFAYCGGVNPENMRASGLWGEWERIPSEVRRKISRKDSNMKWEELVDLVKQHGYADVDHANWTYKLTGEDAKRGLLPKEAGEKEQMLAELDRLNRELERLKTEREAETSFNPSEWEGQEGFARFRDDKGEQKGLFGTEDFALTPGLAGERKGLSLKEQVEASKRALETEQARRLTQQKTLLEEKGPLFEKEPEQVKEPQRPTLAKEVEAQRTRNRGLTDQEIAERAEELNEQERRDAARNQPAQNPILAEIERLKKENQVLRNRQAEPKAMQLKTAVSSQKLRTLAESMNQAIQEKRNPAIANQNVTARRARIAEGIYHEADRLEKIQNKLGALADAHEAGTAPEILKGISSRAQMEAILNRSRFPEPYLHNEWIKDIINATERLPNTRADRAILSRVQSRKNYGGALSGDTEIQAAKRLINKAEDRGVPAAKYAKDSIAEYERLANIGIKDEEAFSEAKKALESIGKQTVDRTKEQQIRQAEHRLLGREIPGYFPTPKETAERLVSAAEIKPGMEVLEPSAGKGNIADAIKSIEPEAKLSTIEYQNELADILRLKGHAVVGSDFMETNPAVPWEYGQEWKYNDFSDWAKQLAKDFTRKELEARYVKESGEQPRNLRAHLRSIEKSTSMTSNSQARAQSGNVVRANYEARTAVKNALVIYDQYPQFTKEGGEISPSYDRIIMNPPFERFQDIDHVRHAYNNLKPGGRIVSVMSEAPFFRSDKKAVDFREWLDEVGGRSEKLPERSFAEKSERATGVNPRMVVIDKPIKPSEPKAENRLIEEMKTEKPKLQPVESIADQTAQMEVDRRAQNVHEAIDRVMKGPASWEQKRKMLGLPRGGGINIPISKIEVDRLISREMADTENQTGLKATKPVEAPKPAPAKKLSLFGDEEGFAHFRNRPLIDDDPQMKAIFDRLERAERNSRRAPFDIIPKLGEEDTPGANKHPVSWIRSADQALARNPETAPVAHEIKYAARAKKQAMQKYDDLANEIVKQERIKKGSEEDRMIKDLLDESYTGMSPEKLRKSLAYQGDKEAAIRAAEKFRTDIFDPIINQIRNDPELVGIIGKKGYIRGYFPHFMEQMKAKYGKEYLGMVRALLPERFVSAFLKERESEAWANNVSIFDVIPSYINSTMKTIHDIPAYNRAGNIIKTLPEGPTKDFAQWYADNYMGQPGSKEGLLARNEKYQKFSRWLANRYYDNLIGLNYGTWLVNLGQTLTNTFPELGTRYTSAGIKALFTREGRQRFHDSGLLFDYPGMESGIMESGLKRKLLHGGMAAGEYVNRGIAYLGGLEQAKGMGLVGRAADMHAMDVVDKTQFAYGKESSIRYLENLPPDLRVFQTFPLKEAEFVRNLVTDAYKGGKEERIKLTRFLAVNALLPAALTAAGVPVGRMFVDIFDMIPKPFRTVELQRRMMSWLYQVKEGKVPAERIPLDILTGLYDAIGPAANIGKQVARKTGLVEDVRKSQGGRK